MNLQFLFAPGAGAPSSSPWMTRYKVRLTELGRVHCFDYPYRIAGRRSPDRLPVLLAAHRSAFEGLESGRPVVLIGKSMGGRIGCHLANQLEHGKVQAVVCLGYPLLGQSGVLRDEVLVEMRVPVLFVQGSRDPLCPLDRLAEVRARMTAPNELYAVEGGNHSLELTKTALRERGTTQDDIDAAVIRSIEAFLHKTSTKAAQDAPRVAR